MKMRLCSKIHSDILKTEQEIFIFPKKKIHLKNRWLETRFKHIFSLAEFIRMIRRIFPTYVIFSILEAPCKSKHSNVHKYFSYKTRQSVRLCPN